ncbi:MAG: SdpI family protein [Oscillospiraceae bacterium]|nr:SdpI family protein [Oscillospiraceae bacterium]
MIQIAPGLSIPSGRGGVFWLPAANVALSVALYLLTDRLAKSMTKKALEEERQTDIAQVLPGIRVFFMAWLSVVALAVVYGFYTMDTGRATGALLGRVIAFVPGVGVALLALRFPRTTKNSTLALRWVYTEQSPTVWLAVHKLATRTLYLTGVIMVASAFFASGLWAVITAGIALGSAMFGLYLYARWLYEDGFRG